MALKGATELTGLFLGVLQHAMGGSDLGNLRGVAADLVSPLEALHQRGVGGSRLGGVLRSLRGERRVDSFSGIYSDAALGNLRAALHETDVATLVHHSPNVATTAFEEGLDPARLAEIGNRWETLLDGLVASGTGPTLLIRRRLPLHVDQVVTTGRPAMWTTRGGTLATRRAVMEGIDDHEALAHLARDLREPDTLDAEGRAGLQARSGFRNLPYKGDAANIPVPFGGALPEPLTDTETVLRRMGLHSDQVRGTDLGNQKEHFEYASRAAALLFLSAVEALASSGGRLQDMYPEPHLVGAVAAHAYPPLDVWHRLFEFAAAGKPSRSGHLLAAGLLDGPLGLWTNVVGSPYFDYAGVGGYKADRAMVLRDVIPPDIAQRAAARTGGPKIALSAACASIGNAVALGAMLLSERRRVRQAPQMVQVMASEAPFVPYAAPAAVAGLGTQAPLTDRALVEMAIKAGKLSSLDTGETAGQRWRKLDARTQWDLLNRFAFAPGTNRAKGFPIAEGSVAVQLRTLGGDLRRGQYPRVILAGWATGSGEAGKGNLAGVSQGGLTTTLRALDMARVEHGVVPSVAGFHWTCTALSNITEVLTAGDAFAARAIEAILVSAHKAATGHLNGANPDIAIDIMSLGEQATPAVFGFDPAALDPRFAQHAAEHLKRLVLQAGPHRGPIEAILRSAFGFDDENASYVVKRVPQLDPDAALEVFRRYHGFTEDLGRQWRDGVATTEAHADDHLERLRTGALTYRDAILELGRYDPLSAGS